MTMKNNEPADRVPRRCRVSSTDYLIRSPQRTNERRSGENDSTLEVPSEILMNLRPRFTPRLTGFQQIDRLLVELLDGLMDRSVGL